MDSNSTRFFVTIKKFCNSIAAFAVRFASCKFESQQRRFWFINLKLKTMDKSFNQKPASTKKDQTTKVVDKKLRYFLYARKSSELEERQSLSIPAQVREVSDFARENGYSIEDIFTEQKSAKIPGRIIFSDMLEKIEQGLADGILSWHPDRLSRNSVDAGKIIHLLDSGLIKDLKFANHWFENSPQGIFILSIAFGQSKYFSDNLSQNVKRGMRQKLKRGEYPSRAPFGYLNDKNTGKFIFDPQVSPNIKKLFKLFATGDYFFADIVEYCQKHNISTSFKMPMNQPALKRIFTNPFYIGLFKWKGEICEGSHEPLITKDLFDQVQRQVKKRSFKMKKAKETHYFRGGFIKCGQCGYSITSQCDVKKRKSGKVVRYYYFRCTQKGGRKTNPKYCNQPYVQRKYIYPQIRKAIKQITLPKEQSKQILAWIETEQRETSQSASHLARALQKSLQQLNSKLERLLEGYLDKVITQPEYLKKKETLLFKKRQITDILEKNGQDANQWLRKFHSFIKAATPSQRILLKHDYRQMRHLLASACSDIFLQNKKLEFIWRKEWKLLAQRKKSYTTKAKYYIDNLSENVKRGLRQKLRNGVLPNKAPVGYLNNPETRLIDVNPNTGKLVKRAFKLFSTEKYSFTDIQRFFFKHKVTGRTGKPMKIENVKKMFQDPFYYGLIKFTGETFQGSHKPLIKKSLFDQCHQIVVRRSKPNHKNYKTDFAFLGFARCPECNSAITAERHIKYYKKTKRKAVYRYYRCAKKTNNCSQPYITAEDLEKQIRQIVFSHSLHPTNGHKMLEKLSIGKVIERGKTKSKIKKLKFKLELIDQKLQRLLDGYLEQIVDTNNYQLAKQKLLEEKLEIEERILKIKQKGTDWIEPMDKFIKGLIYQQKIAKAKNNGHELSVMAKKTRVELLIKSAQA